MKAFLFDTETTDLIANSLIAERHRPCIIEFFGQTMELVGGKWTKVDELEFFCKPPMAVSEEVTRITGITNDDLEGAKPFKDHADSVRAIIERADWVVAHNLSYDEAVVDFELERLKQTVKWPDFKLCTVEATEHLKGHRLKLADLYEHLFGEKFEGAHRARTDVEGMTRCFVELWERGEI